MVDIFVLTWGQSDNLGDVILRRHFFQTLRQMGHLCLLAGPHFPASYVDCLIEPDDEVFDDIGAWRAELIRRAGEKRVALCEVPSEIVSQYNPAKYFVRQSLLAVQLRRLGMPSLLVGLGLRMKPSLPYRIIYRAAVTRFGMLGWRDPGSAELIGSGFTMPDWAFGIETGPEDGSTVRNRLVVSLRGDRPEPSDVTIEAIKIYAAQNALTIVVMVQVYRDIAAGRELAKRLACHFIEPERNFSALENQVRALYKCARLVISDRLHVLILAAVEGAPPACLVEYRETKIGRHFDAIGVHHISQDILGKSPSDIVHIMDALSRRSHEISLAVKKARVELSRISTMMEKFISDGSTR